MRDAWFIGYSLPLITGVWVGYDDFRPLGNEETGGQAASPIWLDFMKKALEGVPARDFPLPDSIIIMPIPRLKEDKPDKEPKDQVIWEAFPRSIPESP
jgi:penicillin-binding protein 1A